MFELVALSFKVLAQIVFETRYSHSHFVSFIQVHPTSV